MGVILSSVAIGSKIKERNRRKKEEKISRNNPTGITTALASTTTTPQGANTKTPLQLDTNLTSREEAIA